MSELLEKAFSKIKKLSQTEQDALASLIFNELEAEEKWSQSFAKSPELLAEMAQKALKEYDAGVTEELDPDRL
jgi:hypothetical protein